MTQTISKYKQKLCHVTSIHLETVGNDTLCLEVVIEFTEKEFTETLRDNVFKHSTPQKENIEKVLAQWEEVFSYPLRQVSVQELLELRLSKVPGVVYKKDNSFFYAAIPGELSFAGKAYSLGRHACGEQCTMVCKGCSRTSDLTVAYQQRIGRRFSDAVKNSWRVEKYDFIREGLETFNMSTPNDAFIVFQCENYQVRPVKKQLSHEAVGALKAGLASYAWDDFAGNRSNMINRLKEKGLRGSI